MAARVIVFGPTGSVASVVARTAELHGAKVYLAMRDPKKSIPGLSTVEESNGKYERIQADLTMPTSLTTAVNQTRATRAFLYVAHGSVDHMRASLEAMKAAGVEFVVFLSSFTITRELDDIPASTRIPYVHAQVEKNLLHVFGREGFAALRVGAFATNTLSWRAGVKAGAMTLESPDVKYDYITPIDMGTVGGKILADGHSDGQQILYLYGPTLVSQKDALAEVVTALGKRVSWNRDRHTESRDSDETGTQHLSVTLVPREEQREWFHRAYDNLEEGIFNVRKYTGRPGTGFAEWLEVNEALFEEP